MGSCYVLFSDANKKSDLPMKILNRKLPINYQSGHLMQRHVVVYSDQDEALVKAFRNIRDARLVSVKKLAAIDIVSTDDTIFSSSAITLYLGEE